MGCRKNLTRLTLSERQAFVNAVNQLRTNGGYAQYVDQHRGAMTHGHNGPAFFPWHREFILRFERALQAIDSSVNLPYWDWTADNLNANGTESLIWRNDLMGGPGNPNNNFQVTTGPFAAWGILRNNFDIFTFPGGGGTIANWMGDPSYTVFRNIEGPHGGAHLWVGGHMRNPAIAPTDPVFFLLHCNVDRLWSEWIRRFESNANWQPYLPLAGGPQGHNLNDTMWPWNGTTNPFGVQPWTTAPEQIRPADLLDHRTLGYYYDTIDPQCQRIQKLPAPETKLRLFKERLKERPKEFKDFLPKELKERGPKEIKELKEFGPKELAPKERSPKEWKEIREDVVGPFIRPELRPDLSLNALNFETDISPQELEALRTDLEARAGNVRLDKSLAEATKLRER